MPEARIIKYPVIGRINQFPIGDSAGERVGVVELSMQVYNTWTGTLGAENFMEDILWETFDPDTMTVQVMLTAEPEFHNEIDRLTIGMTPEELVSAHARPTEKIGTITTATKKKYEDDLDTGKTRVL